MSSKLVFAVHKPRELHLWSQSTVFSSFSKAATLMLLDGGLLVVQWKCLKHESCSVFRALSAWHLKTMHLEGPLKSAILVILLSSMVWPSSPVSYILKTSPAKFELNWTFGWCFMTFFWQFAASYDRSKPLAQPFEFHLMPYLQDSLYTWW